MQLTEPDFSRRLNISLRARVTLIVVITPEEERAVAQIQGVCETWDPPRQCIAWDSVDGFSVIAGTKNFPNQSRDPLTALDDLSKTGEDAVVILKDFHEFWNNPQIKRRIRNFSQAFRYNRRTIIIVTPTSRVPDEIRDEAVIVHFPPRVLPNSPPISTHSSPQVVLPARSLPEGGRRSSRPPLA